MIKLIINGKKQEIPTCDELTVRQYTDLMKKENYNFINYLSVVTGMNYKESFNAKIKNAEGILKVIGSVKDITKVKAKSKFVIENEIYHRDKCLIETVGQRIMIEEAIPNFKNVIDQMLFIMATGILKEPDYEKVIELRNKLFQYNYIKILPIAFFLNKSLRNGGRNVMNIFLRLRNTIKIRH